MKRLILVTCAIALGGGWAKADEIALSKERPVVNEPIFVTGAAANCSYAWYKAGTDGTFAEAPFSTRESVTLTPADYEHWIKVVVSKDNVPVGEDRLFFSRLPVCYIDVEGGAVPTSQKEEHDATIRIQGNGTYVQQYDGKTSIKVRGNSTSVLPKKPWKLKLGKKADVFGLGAGEKNKHWALLANYYDESQMRNTVANRLSGVLGLTNMKTEWVDVILNGAYEGCYQFCQQIRIGVDRVNVYCWPDAPTKVAEKFAAKHALDEDDTDELAGELDEDLSWISTDRVTWKGVTEKPSELWEDFTDDTSGGYLYELSEEYDEVSKFIVTSGVLRVKTMVNTPQYLNTNPDMWSFSTNLWQRFWDACTAADNCSRDGRHYSSFSDMEAMAAYWLTQVIMSNDDSKWKSRYAYIDQGGKLTFGPAWDFDQSSGSPVLRTPAGDGTYLPVEPTGWKIAALDHEAAFYREWSDDPFFCLKLYEKYWANHAYIASIARNGGLIDQHAAYLAEAGAENEAKWMYRIGFSGPNGDVAAFKTFMAQRIAWLDRQFASVSGLQDSLRVAFSAAPYRRDGRLGVSLTGLNWTLDGSDTNVVDACVGWNQSVSGTISLAAFPTAVRVLAYVNALPALELSVVDGQAKFDLAAENLLGGERNLASFVALDASGNVLARNYALMSPQPARVQLGRVAERYPWNGIVDVEYRVSHAATEETEAVFTVEAAGEVRCSFSVPIKADGTYSLEWDAEKTFPNRRLEGVKIRTSARLRNR